MLKKINIYLVILLSGFFVLTLFQGCGSTEAKKEPKNILKNQLTSPSEKKQDTSTQDDSTSELSEQQQYVLRLDEIKEIILKNNTTATEVIRSAMEFVHNNSMHLEDEEHREYAFNLPVVIPKLILAYRGQEDEKPHLTCGPRAYAMKEILSRFGIYARLIQVYSDHAERVLSHRFLEVFNPETESYEVWDPTYSVTYFERGSNKRVDIMTLIFGDKNMAVPRVGDIIGWEETKTKDLRDYFFEAVLFEHFRYGMVNCTIIVNRNKFDMDKKFSDGLTFKEWAFKYYEFPRIIVLPYRN